MFQVRGLVPGFVDDRPLGIGFAAHLFGLPTRGLALIWVALFVWMGTGCILNARRCHRPHCYISGPVFLLGAVARLVGGGPAGVRAARTQQHRRGYAACRVVVIRSRDLEKIRRLVTAVALLLNGRTGD